MSTRVERKGGTRGINSSFKPEEKEYFVYGVLQQGRALDSDWATENSPVCSSTRLVSISAR